jgi:DNA-binding beta-propeller fold protein YncE
LSTWRGAHPGSQDPDVPIGALGQAKAGVLAVGLAQNARTPAAVPVGGGAGGTVYVVDPEAGAVLDTIDVPGSVVRSWAGDPAAGAVYLTIEMGPAPGVLALNTESLELGDPIPIEGQTPLGVDPNTGTVWVAGGGAVTILE